MRQIHAFIHVTFLFVVALLMFACICGHSFSSQKGLSVHRSRCAKIPKNPFTATGLLKRKQARDEVLSQKKARVEVEEPAEVDPDQFTASFSEEVIQPTDDVPLSRPSGRPNRRRRLPRQYDDFVPSALAGRSSTSARGGIPDTYHPPPPSPQPPPQSLDHHTSPPQASAEPFILVYQDCDQNDFGLFRSYLKLPVVDPEDSVSLDDVCEAPTLATAAKPPPRWWLPYGQSLKAVSNAFAPFLNATTYRLMSWMYSGSNMKSLGEVDRLVDNVILADDFDRDHLRGFSAAREAERVDEWEDVEEDSDSTPQFKVEDGWKEASVHIRVPSENTDFKYPSESDAPTFEVKGLHHRRLIEVIKSAFQDTKTSTYNLIPYRLFWNSESSTGEGEGARSPPERVYSEVYNSEAMIEEYEKIQQAHPPSSASPGEPVVENVIAGIMLWSDSTHLAQFGTASLWPIYLFFANQSKYIRCKPTEFAAHHLAYIPSLPDSFQDFYMKTFKRAASSAVLTHCKRELMHAIWDLLLDNEFMEAYEHGIVLRFADGIQRRVFPRFFTYSADYPEKVLLATIRYLASCPCPRCLVPKGQIYGLGTVQDRRNRANIRVDDHPRRYDVESVRSWIFERGLGLASAFIKRIFDPKSWTPTRNAFSTRLSVFGVNFYTMFAPDLLHEFELGVWKAVFIHLLRILHAAGGNVIQELNQRYRMTPTFGRDIIRRFTRNTSGMKKLAARDWEDMLQCAIPVFEGLLPAPYDAVIQDLLFVLATWHACAKLRLHTDSTLSFLDKSTTSLGQMLRKFNSVVCSVFETYDLPTEEAARGRINALLVKKGKAPRSTTKRRRLFNMATYKLHALGDYLAYARWFGPSDNYSTQTGELEHRRVKRFYARTSKHGFVRQIAKQQRREEILRRIADRQKARKAAEVAATAKEKAQAAQQTSSTSSTSSTSGPTAAGSAGTTRLAQDSRSGTSTASPALNFTDSDPLPYTSPDQHHHMSLANRFHVNLYAWLRETEDDPATKNFLPTLQDHLYARLSKMPYSGDENDFTDNDRHRVLILQDRLYRHKVLRVNYTTYDVRRGQDSLNPRTHPDIMVLAHEDNSGDSHPYWFARIIGVYHVNVKLLNSDLSLPSGPPKRMEFLWVRWFGRDPGAPSGWRARRLPRIGFVDATTEAGSPPFGFLDPAQVIRGVHLMPAFAHGRTTELLPPSIARQPDENDEDWQCYYVGIFVDRDMFMRFRGGGVGHRSTQEVFKNVVSDEEDVVEEEFPVAPDASHQPNQPTEPAGVDNEDDTPEEPEGPDEDDEDDEEAEDETNANEPSGGDDEDEEEAAGAEDGEDGVMEDDYGFAPL
ncbi:hypothetical protein EUX98_g9280 [Antrodiella citrinella]|uniref:C2H2-type domain-containing protein n=1 Tax=Antrodiella citrinella TaxID=2447956 RepID=A0A4S4LXT9_9APHY|nr:hypothetical protein EUX98_g9280 [Antrodiella citrinella]